MACAMVFLPPTALKLMRQVGVRNAGVNLRSMLTGGESSAPNSWTGCARPSASMPTKCTGQTECNLVVGQQRKKLFPIRRDRWAAATPGFDVRIVDERGEEVPRGERGHHRRAPARTLATMIEYWSNRKDREEIMPDNSCSPAISAKRMRTATSGTSAARTT